MARPNRDYLIAAGAAAQAARIFRRDWVARTTSRVTSFALRQSTGSGSRVWLYVAAGAQGLRICHRVLASKPEVFQIKLRPGEGVEIREVARPQ
jgi:hypothetical protein